MPMIQNLEAMLARGTDNALLRYSLGNAYFNEGSYDSAVLHLSRAVAHDPGYSAAWKVYGRALAALEKYGKAVEVYEAGIAAAEKKGDVQAVKEMRVFLKRVQKTAEESSS